ncbi:uncharacterized protein LOC113350832 [Papaver somniferum]|uniref:uncharacterized protein LOC113350832 n=1 Tax=Papaver somniferum TaxID=3469 RepID=UPI000E6F9A43|nr:uncharacterized protein LOC113350832 [Papaver somniferum]
MNFLVPKLPEFDEKTDDPDQHVLHYETAMTLWKHSDELMCKMFPQSLVGGAIKWFNKLPAHSIDTYHELVEEFCSHYKYNRRDRKGYHVFFLLGIRKEESIRQFTRRFKQELADVDGSNNQIVIMHTSTIKELTELYEKISKDLSPPRPFPAETRDKRDKNKYCKFHKDPGHKTENCRTLQIEVQRMIDVGKLQEYVKKDFGKIHGKFGAANMINAHVIDVSHARIHSMTMQASEDETRRKLRQSKEWYLTNHIDFVSGNGEEIRELGCTKIELSEADMIGLYAPHNDSIVITAWIGMFRVHRLLVDTGSSVSVLFSGAYSSMNLPHDLIEEDENPIIGFSGEVTKEIGKVKIPIKVADKSVLGNFLLLNCRAPYNAIVGRDWLHEIGAVTSSYHQCLNFLAPEGVVKVRSDQMAAHKCHESAMDEYRKSEVSGNQIMQVEQK